MSRLAGKKVAILVTDGFEQSELTEPMERLKREGADVKIVSPNGDTVKGWIHGVWGDEFPVDAKLDQTSARDFDALLLPGGVINPDKLRRDERAVKFVRECYELGKPIAAICHGPIMLIEARVIKGLRATSFHAIKTDMRNAGADWVDEPVVVDHGVLTSRQPSDIPAFNDKMVEEFAEGTHRRPAAVDELAEAMRASV